MPIAKDYEKPVVPNPVSHQTSTMSGEVRINNPAYKSAVVQSKFTPLASLITHISGSLWGGGVIWYSQVLGASEEPTAFDINLPPIYQQYRKITKVQIKVTTPLSYEQLQDSNDPELQGIGTTLGGFIPNEGDVFLADVGSGREGLFIVNKVPEKKNIFAEGVYEISYTFASFSDVNQRYIDILNERVVKTEVYSPPNNNRPSYTLIDQSSVSLREELELFRKETVFDYHDRFYNSEKNTYLDPDGYYDGGVVDFIRQLISPRELPILLSIDIFRLGNYFPSRKDLIWKMLLTAQWGYISSIVHKAVLVDLNELSTNVPGTIAIYNGIHYAVVPDVPEYSNLNINTTYTMPIWEVDETLQTSHNPTLTRPMIHPVIYDEYYVLSKHFYTKQLSGMSEIETVLYLYLNKLPIDPTVIKNIYTAYKDLSNKSLYYYGPIMIVLFNYAIASI